MGSVVSSPAIELFGQTKVHGINNVKASLDDRNQISKRYCYDFGDVVLDFKSGTFAVATAVASIEAALAAPFLIGDRAMTLDVRSSVAWSAPGADAATMLRQAHALAPVHGSRA